MLALSLLQTAIFPFPNAKTHVFSYTLPYPLILQACFHKLLSAFSYLMHTLDDTPTLQKLEPIDHGGYTFSFLFQNK